MNPLLGTPRRRPIVRKYIAPDERQARVFRSLLRHLIEYADHDGLRVVLFTFSSQAWGSDDKVMAHLKRRWALFQQSAIWRRVPGALWVFGTHERPHVHIAAVMPPDLTINEVRNCWRGGFSNARTVIGDGGTLGSYLAAQRAPASRRRLLKGRFFGSRIPSVDGLAYPEGR